MKKKYQNEQFPDANAYLNIGLDFESTEGRVFILQLVAEKDGKAVCFMEFEGGQCVRIGRAPCRDEMIHYHDFKRDALLYVQTGKTL